MGKPLTLEWRLKGRRDYLQGADLHDQICAALVKEGLGELSKIDFTMHKMAREGLTGFLQEQDAPAPDQASAVLRFRESGRAQAVYLVPNGEAITRREPFAEEEIVRLSKVDLEARNVTLGSASLAQRFSTLELVVAMNKLLLQRLFPEASGKWIFTKLQLPLSLWGRPLDQLELRFEIAFEFALVRSLILHNDAPAGRIFFSLST